MIHEHHLVMLRSDLPSEHLKSGTVGTVVHLYQQSSHYEVEFLVDAKSLVVTLSHDDIEPILTPTENAHP